MSHVEMDRGKDMRFGVSSLLWDIVFGTMPVNPGAADAQ